MKGNVIFYVTRQYMKKNKRRTLTMFAGIVCMVLLMTCVFVGRDTGIAYLEEVASLKDGKWHVSMYGVTQKEREEVEQLSYVKETAASAAYGCTVFEQSANKERPYLNVKGYGEPCFDWMNIRVLEGRLPESETELIVSQSALEDGAALAVGDTVEAAFFERSVTGTDSQMEKTVFPFYELTLAYGETKAVPESFPYFGENESFRENKEYTGQKGTYKVVGIMETPSYEDAGAAGYTALTVLKNVPETFNLSMLLTLDQLPPMYFMELREIAGDHEIDFNNYMLSFSGNSSDSTFNAAARYMTVFFIVLIIACSLLLIYNVFNMSFQERSRYLGMLCSVGATGRQKRSSIFYEAFSLLIFALPVGILLGIAVIYAAMAKLRPMIGVFMGLEEIVEACPAGIKISPENIVLTVAFSVVTVVISAWLPARKIGKIGPVECIRGNVEKRSRQYRISPKVIRIAGAEGMLAKNTMARRGKKTKSAAAAAGVFMVLMVVTAFGSSAVHRIISVKLMRSDFTTNPELYDYMVYNSYTGEDRTQFEALKQEITGDPGVERVLEWSDAMFAGQVSKTVYSQEYWDACHDIYDLYYHRKLSEEEYRDLTPDDRQLVNIVSMDDDTLLDLARAAGADAEKLLDEEQNAALVVNEGDISTDSLSVWGMRPERYRFYHIGAMTDLEQGGVIPVSFYSGKEERDMEMSLEVAGLLTKEQLKEYVTDLGTNFIWLIVNTKTAGRIADMTAGKEGNMLVSPYLLLRMNGEETDLPDRLRRLSEQNDSGIFLVESGYTATMAKAILQTADILLACFVALTSVICLLNLFNSIRGWILGSRQEFAVLRSLGMTSGQMKRMLLYECGGIFFRALLQAGILAGVLICIVRTGIHVILGNMQLPISLAWTAASVILAGAALLSLTLFCFETKRGGDIFESIRNENI
ncbi:MAG: FtsX-like permease family protein [Lachnospiraceae bacterium]|nr:FtsX-like permease family protein [Lachnospiraceae bacterium]